MERLIRITPFILIIVAGIISYGNTLNGNFIWDDELLVTGNVYIKDWSKILNILAGDFGPGPFMKGYLYRPVQMVTYMLDYSFWGLNATGYHLTNLFLHILVALAAYWLVNIIFGARMLSFLTGIFFVVNPLHTEAVTYISGRADPLASLFVILCLILYIKQTASLRSKSLFCLILLSYVLALLSKECSLIVPILFLFYSYAFGKKVLIREFLSVSLISVIYIILRWIFIPSHTIASGNPFQRIPGFFAAIAEYLRLLLFPSNLHMEYGNRLFSLYDIKVMLGFCIAVLLLMLAFLKRKEHKLLFFSILWFFIVLLPVSNLYPVNAYMAEHWLYLPSLGFFIILASIFININRIKHLKTVTAIAIVCLISFYSISTIRQNDHWKSNFSFVKWTLQFVPDSSRLYGLACKTCMDYGDVSRSEIFCRKAVEIDPRNASAYSLLGDILGIKGLYEDSIAYFKKAISINPEYIGAYNDLGVTYARMHNFAEAKKAWEEGLKIYPESKSLQNNLRRLGQE